VQRTFVHREHGPTDPAFLRDERSFLERQWGALHVMERQRDQLVHDIDRARSLATRAGIPQTRLLDPDRDKLLAVIGIGDRSHRDDAAGLEVARRLRLAHPPGVVVLEEKGEPTSLIDAWSGVDQALVIETIRSGSPPGTIRQFDVSAQPLPPDLFRPSPQGPGLAEAVELARELDRLPPRLVVYGIEGLSFEASEGLTPAVQRVVTQLVLDLYRELSGAS
jgi:hydrogenase maturation protease